MTRDQAHQHLIKARRVIAGWERLGMPGGPPEDVFRVVHEEIDMLLGIIAEHPTKAIAVDDLIKRYEAIGHKVRGQGALRCGPRRRNERWRRPPHRNRQPSD